MVSRLLGGTAAETTSARMIPTKAIGIRATPHNKGPLGVSHKLAAQTPKKIITKKAQMVPHGPLFRKPKANTIVIIKAIISEKINSVNSIKDQKTVALHYGNINQKLLLPELLTSLAYVRTSTGRANPFYFTGTFGTRSTFLAMRS